MARPERGCLVDLQGPVFAHPGEELVIVRPLEDGPDVGHVGVEGPLLHTSPGLPDRDGGGLTVCKASKIIFTFCV